MLEHVDSETVLRRIRDGERPVLVDFGAAWCHPCKRLDPVVESLAEEWEARLDVMKVDVDESTDVAMQYRVMGVPTLILFIAGQPVERITGYAPRRRLEKRFAQHLPPVGE